MSQTTQYLNLPDKSKLRDNPQMQNQVLYAPFVKASDKVKKDVVDLSLADFQPKRFALNYDPPMIILEYLVPSTGKLYHHKMKLRRLTGKSTVKECIIYLQKRHPLYFINDKMRIDQVTDLIERLIFRVKQKEEMFNSKNSQIDKVKSPTQLQPENNIKENEKPVFKSGNQLPSIKDDQKIKNAQQKSQFPSLSIGIPGEKNLLEDKAKKMFEGLNFDKDDDGADLDFEQGSESEDGNFNSKQLFNLSGYQNKRKDAAFDNKKNTPATNNQKNDKFNKLSIKDVFDDKKKQELNKIKDEDDWGISNDDWGDLDTAPKEINLNKEDLKNKNLNKLSDAELAAHKRAMDKDFSKNQLKPGDQGFVYDKVVDFSKKGQQAPLEDDSWGEDDGIMEGEENNEEENQYYDEEDFEGEDELDKYTNNQMLQNQKSNRESNLESGQDENDYFDDDFDNDFN